MPENISMSLFYEYFNDALPVPGHEDEGVDGDVGGDVDDVLDGPAPGEAEGPVHDVVTGSGGDTDLARYMS